MSYNINNLYQAIRNNDENEVKLIIESGIIPDTPGLNEAIIYNNQPIIDILLNNNAIPDLLSLNMSVARQNKYIFDLLLEKYNIIPNNTTINEISGFSNYEISIYFLNKLIEKNVYPDLNTLNIFIYSNNLNIIEIIIKYISPQIIYVDSLSDVSSTIIEYLNNNGFQLQQNQDNIDNNEYM